MVEVDLPPSFELDGLGQDGGLDDVVRRGVLHAHEMHRGRLALYLADLAPGAVALVPFDVIALFPGAFATGAVEAYPYYRPTERFAVALPPVHVLTPEEALATTRTQAQSDVAAAAPPAPEKKPPASRSERTGEAPKRKPKKDAVDVSGASSDDVVIAWDEELGSLEVDYAGMPYGTSALDLLVTRALFAGLPSLADSEIVEPDRVMDFTIRPCTWSDGRPVTPDDFADAWREARARLSGRSHADTLVDARQLALLDEISVEIRGRDILRVRTSTACRDLAERLDRYPFLPAGRARGGGPGGLVGNGFYQLARVDRRAITLSRRVDAPRGPERIRIERVERDRARRLGADVLWTASDDVKRVPAASALFAVVTGATGERDRAALTSFLEAIAPRLDTASGLARGGPDASAPPVLPPVKIGYDRESLADFAAGLGSLFVAMGIDAAVEAQPTRAPLTAESRDLGLFLTWLEIADREGDDRVPISFLLTPAAPCAARLDPASIDPYGYLIYPPRVHR
jgi:hypothetical protein